jgi:hypothetical protein
MRCQVTDPVMFDSRRVVSQSSRVGASGFPGPQVWKGSSWHLDPWLDRVLRVVRKHAVNGHSHQEVGACLEVTVGHQGGSHMWRGLVAETWRVSFRVPSCFGFLASEPLAISQRPTLTDGAAENNPGKSVLR